MKPCEQVCRLEIEIENMEKEETTSSWQSCSAAGLNWHDQEERLVIFLHYNPCNFAFGAGHFESHSLFQGPGELALSVITVWSVHPSRTLCHSSPALVPPAPRSQP